MIDINARLGEQELVKPHLLKRAGQRMQRRVRSRATTRPKAVYYPDDVRFLVLRSLIADHCEVG